VRKFRLFIPVVLGLAFVAQGLWFIGTQSLTYDEPVHVVTGLDIWQSGTFARWNDHPPLARALFAVPLLGGHWQIEPAFRQNAWNEHSSVAWLLWTLRDPQVIAWRARSVNLLLGAVLAALLWMTARRMFSEGAANVALLLFAFSPCVIAHFSLATTDGIGALMVFATAISLVAWSHNPSRLQTVLLGLVMGGLLLAKFYTFALFGLAIVLVLFLRPKWAWRQAALILGIAFFVCWAAYLFHISWLNLHDGQLAVQSPGAAAYRLGKLPTTALSFSIPLPAGEYLTGLYDVLRHSRWGHPSFFLGHASDTGGWKLYYPIVMLLKWPTVALLLGLAFLLPSFRRRLSIPRDLRIMLLFPGVFLLLSIFSRIDIGDRHILPLYPFLLLLCAGLWEFARTRRTARVLLFVALGLHVADGMRYAPDYLSYFNVFVKPQNSYQLLSDSNVDWGEGLIALREYQDSHPNEQLYMAYFGSVYPSQYGIRALPLRENERVSGTVVVSATHLSGQLLRDSHSYRWLLQYPRAAILNHTLHVFQVPRSALQASD
jgi:4-amino-4-deoxy-L-arabinose transferase-like glycosyltransferase